MRCDAASYRSKLPPPTLSPLSPASAAPLLTAKTTIGHGNTDACFDLRATCGPARLVLNSWRHADQPLPYDASAYQSSASATYMSPNTVYCECQSQAAQRLDGQRTSTTDAGDADRERGPDKRWETRWEFNIPDIVQDVIIHIRMGALDLDNLNRDVVLIHRRRQYPKQSNQLPANVQKIVSSWTCEGRGYYETVTDNKYETTARHNATQTAPLNTPLEKRPTQRRLVLTSGLGRARVPC